MELALNLLIVVLLSVIAALALTILIIDAIDRFPFVRRLLAPNYRRGLDRELTPLQARRYERAARAHDRATERYDRAVAAEKARRRHRAHVSRNAAALRRGREADRAHAAAERQRR